MSIIWNGSIVPWLDPNGAPYSGAKVFFFNANTTTPRTVYRDSDMGLAHDHPVVANSAGRFPAIFLPAGDYRQRIEDASGVVIDDTDGITTPIATDGGGGGGGDTPVELLFRTGDYKDRHDTGSHSGWVRAAGRTIGAAASGATERANADTEDLFTHLWAVDSTLAVSGGRGINASSDYAASKTIALPDFRLRASIGMASMGNSVSTLIPAGSFDNSESGDVLGATVGAGSVTLAVGEIPAHTHTGHTSSGGNHQHRYGDNTMQGGGSVQGGGSFLSNVDLSRMTDGAGVHSHDVLNDNAGGGGAHANVQPSIAVTRYIKL